MEREKKRFWLTKVRTYIRVRIREEKAETLQKINHSTAPWSKERRNGNENFLPLVLYSSGGKIRIIFTMKVDRPKSANCPYMLVMRYSEIGLFSHGQTHSQKNERTN